MKFTESLFVLLLTALPPSGQASAASFNLEEGQLHSLITGKQDLQGPTLIQVTHKKKPGYMITWGPLKAGSTKGRDLIPLPAKVWQDLKLEMDQLKQAKKFKTNLAGCVRPIEFTSANEKNTKKEIRCWDTANRNEQLKLDLFVRKAYALYSRKNPY